jgi:hypothetical protein
MQTINKSGTISTMAVASQSAAYLPCHIPVFCRSHFYTGKLLTENDLNREQRYTIDKLRLHYVALHGWGVACGLMVRPHPQCPDRFVVTPGFAVDDCGREVRLIEERVVEFPKPVEPPKDPCPPEPCDDDDREKERPHRPKGQTWYVCIQYCECREDFMPVIFDDCCGSSPQPNKICECAEVKIYDKPPECFKEIEARRHRHEHREHEHYEREHEHEHHEGENHEHEREHREYEHEHREHEHHEHEHHEHEHHEHEHERRCHEIWEHIPKTCPPTGRVCCIPLAVIRDYVYCEPLTEHMIDNSIRRVLPSIDRLEDMIDCVREHLPKPAPRLTHITRVKWIHDREYTPGEFLREFVGTHESPRGFEIEFDGPVHLRTVNSRTFQAMIVRDLPESHEPRRVEIAPARVRRSEDGHRCSLHIDHEYARHHLHDHNFDVIITIHCDKVVDVRGFAVDGELLAMVEPDEDREPVRYPTGNGVPGGLFESWIRVRRDR